MSVFNLFVIFIYVVQIHAVSVKRANVQGGSTEDVSPEYNPHLIVVWLQNLESPNKILKRSGLRQAKDPEVVNFFPFCSEACLDLDGKCNIDREKDCKRDRTPCYECDASKKKCKEKCLNIVNYH